MQHLLLLLLCMTLWSVRTRAASVYFNNVYQGAGTGYNASSSPIANITLLQGTGFRFTSLNPDAPNFVADAGGNDIRGTLNYVDPTGRVIQITGIVSRLDKINGVPEGFYFVDLVNGKGYLLVLAGSESMYRAGTDVRTSSESTLLSSLNTTVTDQQSEPRLSIANTSAVENAGFMVFNLTVNPAASSNFSFTPTLAAGTATSPSDYTTSMQYNTGNGWQPVSGPINVSASVTSFQIRVPLVDDNVVESNETFILNSGPITGGNFLNHQGTFGQASILDNDGNPAPISQSDVVYTYGDGPFTLNPSSPNTTGGYTYSVTGPGGVVMQMQQTNNFSILGVGVTQVTIYQAPGSGYGMGTQVVKVTVLPASLQIKAIDKTKLYDGLAFTGGNGVTYTGLVYGETPAVLSGTLQYSGSSQQAVNAGTYGITPGGLSSNNYSITYVGGQLHVLKASLTITAADEVKTYDGQPYSGGNGVGYAGFVAGETTAVLQGALRYGGTAQGAKNVATYAIAPSGFTATNYNVSYISGRLVIDPAPLTISAQAQSKVYNGQVYSGGHSVTYNGFVSGDNETNALTGTLSYTGNWQGATAAGTYTITPQGQTAPNYIITYADGTLYINKATLTITVLNRTKNYDGQVYSAGYDISYGVFVNGENPSVLSGTLVYGGNAQAAVNAGNYTITAGGLSAANYNINYVTGILTINKVPLEVRPNNHSKTYDTQPYSGGNGVSFSGFMNGETQTVLGGNLTFGGAAQGAVNMGNYTLTASGFTAANYTISYTAGTLTINPAVLTVTTLSHTKAYDGLAYQGGNGVRYSGFVGNETETVLGGNLQYSGAAQGAKNTGTYALSAGGLAAANYTIQYMAGTLTITPAPLTVQALAQTKVYDGTTFGGTHSVRYSGFVAGESEAVLNGTLSFGGNWQPATAVGDYSIQPLGLTAANYQINYVGGTLSITPANLVATVDNKQKIYDGQVYGGGYTLSVSGFAPGENYQGVLSGTPVFGGFASTAVGAGSYAISAGGLSAANYTITYVPGTLTISKASLLVSAGSATKTYDAQPYAGGNGVSYSGFVAGEDATILGGNLVYGGTAQTAVHVGSYSIIPSGLSAANYDITYNNGTLTINPALLTVAVNSIAKTYDGTSYSGGNGISITGFVGGEDASALSGTAVYGGSAQGARDADSYTLTASGLSAYNYTITYVAGTLTINKAPLQVRAANQIKTYDGQVFSGTHSVVYTGFVVGETAAVLGGTINYGGSWQRATGVGTYAIQPFGLTAANYTITYEAGALEIRPALLTIMVDNKEKTYDGRPFSGGYTLSYRGLVGNETAQTALVGNPRFEGAAISATYAGSYGITASGLTAANYTIQYEGGTLTIRKAALVAAVQSAAKIYDGRTYSGGNGLSFTGFVAGENAAVLEGSARYGGTAQGAKNVGSYTLTADGLSAANYLISYVPGTLAISPATLIARLVNAEKIYDGKPWQGGSGITYTGFVPGEDASVVGGNPQYGGTAQGVRRAGTYTLSLSGLQAANYTITYEPATLTIRPAPLTVKVHDARKVYDGRPYAGTHGVSYAGFVAEETPAVLTGTLAYSGNWQTAINAGSYQIVPGGIASVNYAISFLPGSLVIAKAPLLVTAENKSKTYDGQPFSPAGYTVGYQGFVAGEDERQLSGRLLFGGAAATATRAGSYAIVPDGLWAANYEPHFAAGTLVINKAPLVVKALDHSKTYDGQPFPATAYKVSFGGLVRGEEPGTVLQGTLKFAGTGVTATDAGSYAVRPGGLNAANYDIRYEDGLLTIQKADPVLVLPDVVKTYGDPDFRLATPQSKSTGRFSFALNNDSVALLAGSTVKVLSVGTAPIMVWQAEDRNYNAASASARLVVNKAPLIVVANGAYRCVNDSNPTLSYTIRGFVKGEHAAVLSAQPQVSTTATASSPAGLYPITLTGGAAANYSFRYVESTLRVNKPVRQPVELPLVSMVKGESAQLHARPFGTAYQWLPATGLSAPNAASTEVRVQQDQEFTVKVTENTGCVVVDRVKVRVFEQGGLYVPNAFSPNGDGRNDQLRVIGPGLKLKFFRVFNRFGQIMFETADASRGWDGTFRGTPQPEDTYVWVLMAEKKDGSPLEGKGFVIITR
ncbi:gliding motility-associated C-terminal domain-containing protein [Cnuella takakiae]|uniref:Gliding motility-associated C-terminal domain-containing protein n=1 Tax=Cnuella takakiae TaxID=1302690 RepID=A0A1M5F9R6_9BACT|nr:MBG domain-containing protein [Cnuella takakiae]SHF88267.1 gliding motility-associated C-terminal domain-containing protein [Cnuella takakiae]